MQSVCFLTVVHRFTYVRSSIQDKKVLLLDAGIQTAGGARLRRRTTGDIQTSRRTDNSSAFSRVCGSETHFVSWLSRSPGLVHCSFLTRSDETQPNTVAQGREFVLCQRDVDCVRLVDSWCE